MPVRPSPQWGTGLQEVAPNTYAYLQYDGSWGISNTGFLEGEDGLLIIDATLVAEMAEGFIKEIRRVTDAAYEDARRIAEAVVPKFEDGTYDRVDIVYTQFLSAGTQQVVTRQFLPLDTSSITQGAGDGPPADYEFEPSPDLILDRLLPRYAEARLFAALLEGAASFFAAQQRAMKSATDNAEELITKLSRAMNRARQDAITTEIMEIVGGAEAMRSSVKDEASEPVVWEPSS